MKRMMVSLVLMFLFLTSTTTVYSQINIHDDSLLESISDFYLIDQRLASPEGSALVPFGVPRAENDVYYIVYEYEVLVKKGMDLQVMIDDLMFSQFDVSEQDLQETFLFDIDQHVIETIEYQDQWMSESIQADRINVRVRVSMNAPATFDLYRQIAGGSMTFEVYLFAV